MGRFRESMFEEGHPVYQRAAFHGPAFRRARLPRPLTYKFEQPSGKEPRARSSHHADRRLRLQVVRIRGAAKASVRLLWKPRLGPPVGHQEAGDCWRYGKTVINY
jgi:hypothetical protein